jgi:hypothetical protein
LLSSLLGDKFSLTYAETKELFMIQVTIILVSSKMSGLVKWRQNIHFGCVRLD